MTGSVFFLKFQVNFHIYFVDDVTIHRLISLTNSSIITFATLRVRRFVLNPRLHLLFLHYRLQCTGQFLCSCGTRDHRPAIAYTLSLSKRCIHSSPRIIILIPKDHMRIDLSRPFLILLVRVNQQEQTFPILFQIGVEAEMFDATGQLNIIVGKFYFDVGAVAL